MQSLAVTSMGSLGSRVNGSRRFEWRGGAEPAVERVAGGGTWKVVTESHRSKETVGLAVGQHEHGGASRASRRSRCGRWLSPLVWRGRTRGRRTDRGRCSGFARPPRSALISRAAIRTSRGGRRSVAAVECRRPSVL